MQSIENPSIDRYVKELNRHPVLNREQELALATELQATQKQELADRLVMANLRFVVKVAHEYRGYGLHLLDLIQEGNIGLMMAVKKFDPKRGYRLISYAVWWIRAYIQNYIMRTWSLVKMGTTQAQRKLFFKLRSARERADRAAPMGQRSDSEQIAKELSVTLPELLDMETRMAGRDFYLDGPVTDDSRESHLELLANQDVAHDATLAEHQEQQWVRSRVTSAIPHLNPKERYIVENRLMTEEPMTLQQIGEHFQISRERARQIEGNVLRKIRDVLERGGFEHQLAA